MKKLILIIILLSISSLAVAQQSNKEKYKDYKACTECFDKWGKSSGYDGVSKPFFNKGNEAKSQGKRIVTTVVGIFVAAISIVIYAKANKTANEITQ